MSEIYYIGAERIRIVWDSEGIDSNPSDFAQDSVCSGAANPGPAQGIGPPGYANAWSRLASHRISK
jgi:hypothetical protein